MIDLRSGPAVRDDFVRLTILLDDELRALNGPLQAVYAPYNQLDEIRHFVVAYAADEPVGCAAMKAFGDDAFEVKRVFVRPEFRKAGAARFLMAWLEAEARTLGARRLVLETGDVLVAAQKLYASLGFRRIPNYGQYRDLPASLCFEKVLRIPTDENVPLVLHPVGVIHTPFSEAVNTPIQPIAAQGVRGWIEVFDEFAEGLADLEGFSHITLIYRFHKIREHALKVVPFMDTVERGIFATKAPKRPNQLGISTVRLLGVSGGRVDVEEVDMLDGSPLIDIKPFYPRYDNRDNVRIGWLEKNRDYPVGKMRADGRFVN